MQDFVSFSIDLRKRDRTYHNVLGRNEHTASPLGNRASRELSFRPVPIDSKGGSLWLPIAPTAPVPSAAPVEAMSFPKTCPMRGDFPDFETLYAPQPWRDIAYHAALVEAEGYGRWPRIKEVAELSRRMSYRLIGVAHCPDMTREARLTAKYLEGRRIRSGRTAGRRLQSRRTGALFRRPRNPFQHHLRHVCRP